MEILKVQSTEDKLTYLLQTKALIKQAIIDQGGTITENTTFREFVEQINELNVVEPEVIEEILETLREISEIEEEQNEQIQEIVAALNTKLEEADVADLRTQADSNTNRIGTNENDISILKDRATALENRATDLENDKANKSQVDALSSELELAKTSIQANTSDINAVKTRVESAEGNIATNTTNIETNTSDISNIKNDISELQTSVETNTADILTNKAEFDQAVIDINEEVTKRLTTEAAKPLIKRVDYNSTTATFTFEDMEGNEKVVDLPLEATVKGGRYDAERKVLILVLVSDDEIEIPVSDLVDVYTGIDGTKIKVTVTNANEIKAEVKAGTIEKTDLVETLQNEISGKADKTYVDDEISTEDQKIETNKTNIEALQGRMTTAEGNISDNTTNISGLGTRLTTAEGNIATNTNNIAANTTAISELQEEVAGKLTMKELGDDLLEAAKATSAGTLVPKIFADLQYSHQYRLMLPYITIDNIGNVSYGFQDIISNSVNDAATNPVTLKFIPDENDDDVYIKVEIDQSKLTEVGKVDTVNNIQPDANKNITLDATQINVDETAETKITMKEAIENIKQPLVIDATDIIFLSENSTSEEIFNAFGGKEVIEDIVKNAYIGNTILGRTYAEWGPPSAFGLDLINIDVSLSYDPYGKFDLNTYPSISIYMSFELDGTRYRIELYFYRNDSNIVVKYFGKYISEKVVYLSTSIAGLDKDESTQSEINDALRVSTGDIKTTNYNYKFITFKFGYYDGSTWSSPFYTTGNTNKPVLLDAQIIRDTLDNLYNYKIIVKFIDNDNNILKKLVFTRSNEESDFVISSQEELDLSQITTNKTAIETLDNKIDGVEDRLQEEINNIEVPEYSVVEATTTTGYAKTYSLTKDGVETGTKINIPKDLVIKSGEVKVVTTPDVPYEGAVVGDKYLDIELNDATADHIYIPVKDLVDVYTGKRSINIETIINENNEIESTVRSGTLTISDFDIPTRRGLISALWIVTENNMIKLICRDNMSTPKDILIFSNNGDTKPTIDNSNNLIYNTDAEEVDFNPSTSGLQSTKLAPAIRELKGSVDTNTSDISDLQDAIEEVGKVDTVNNIQPDANKNITLDASNINIDETAETKVTVKSAIENIKQPIVLDSSILRLTEESTSEEVLEAFGGLENIRKVAKAVINKDTEIIVNDTGRTIAGDFVISAHDNDYIVTDSMMSAQAGADLELPSDIDITLNVTRMEKGFEGEVTGLSINCITFHLLDDSVTISSNLKSIIPGIYTISKNIDTLTTTSTPTEILEVIDLIEIDRICHLDSISFCNFEIEDSNRGAPNHVFGKYKFVSLTSYDGYFKFEYLKNQYNDSSNPILKIITIEAHTMYDSDAKVTNIEELDLSQIITNKTAIETLDNKIDGVEDRLQGEIDNIEVPEYTIEEQAQAETGYSKTYYLTKDGTQVGSKINIPKDLVIKSGEVKTVTVPDEPYEGAVVGDKYIDLTLNDANEEHIYIPVKDLVDVYTGVDGDKVNVTINAQNQIEALIKTGTIEETDLTSTLQNKINNAGAVNTVNNVTADQNKNVQLDASNINLDDTAATPETLKSIIEAQATKITTLEGKVAELEAALGDIRTALELLNGVEDANNEEF